MNTDRISELRKEWEAEEKVAHIHGWDFSHIHGRYEEEDDLPWDYKKIIDEYLLPDMKLMDFDTGGGEFLLSLNHPYKNTAATEGYAPNVELCKETLSPLGIDFRSCDDESNIPFADSSFDIMINRHGSFDPVEAHRLLKTGGLFITQQVGGRNDRDLVEMVLPDVPAPFPELELSIQRRKFEEAGFEIIRAEEVFKPIRFYDVGAFVWFAHIIEWEFPGFSVEKCFDKLLEMQGVIDRDGFVEGTIHRYLIVAKKKSISIKKLNYGDFVGQNYEAVIHSDRYLDITPEGEGFSFAWKTIEPELSKTLKDEMLSDWLDNPVAYGAYEGDNIIGFVEGFLEKWNNRFRISNICVFDSNRRQSGVGTKLLEVILKEAVNSKARMAVLETQSYNYKAISFYKKNGFEIIGFDRYAYSNADPEDHNMRIEMGKRF